jgi:hypothetical protein
MFWRKLRTLVAQQWVGLIALFLVLSTGSAYALAGSNTVFSDDIVDGQVTAADIGSGAVASDEIKNGTIVGGDVANNALGGGRITDGSLAGVDVRDGGLTGADVANDSLTGTDINEATLGGLDANDGFDSTCDPGSTAPIICAEATITLARTMNVLVIATSHFRVFGTALASGNCHLEKNLAVDSSDHSIGGAPQGTFEQGGMNLVDVQTLPPATYTFQVLCNEVAGDIAFTNIRLAAVKLSQD